MSASITLWIGLGYVIIQPSNINRPDCNVSSKMSDWAPRLINELANCNEPGHHLIEQISVLCNDCFMALMSMLSRLS